jgi:transposase InsO family protein
VFGNFPTIGLGSLMRTAIGIVDATARRLSGFDRGSERRQRLMLESGLQVRPLRRLPQTTENNDDRPNFFRSFRRTDPNQLWLCDIIRIAFGFVYLAVILDGHAGVIAMRSVGRSEQNHEPVSTRGRDQEFP